MKSKAPLGCGIPPLAQGRGREVAGGIQAHGLGALMIIFCITRCLDDVEKLIPFNKKLQINTWIGFA
ncbi:hypothetical protein [Comamonas aquatica]|uniref:hypothetical protein n=1 Tax=Comamonas aquatica TaxID=225991 RepID=UPI001B390ED6|nr:hypothetical protein [Comamonas aquatica]QTX19596.1 hypothetical protein KAQ61_10970 [Comamonas aquatica]